MKFSHKGAVAEYPFCPLLSKFGYGSLKNTQNNPVILAFFQLRLARILKACPQKSIRQQSPKRIWLVGGAFLFNTAAITFFGSVVFNIPFLSIVLMVLIANKRTAFIWTLVTGIAMEMASPFPMFTYIIAVLITFVCLRAFTIHYMSGKTIFGVVASSFLAILFFEILLMAFARLTSLANAGWIPVLNLTYIWFFAGRLLFSVLIIFFAFLIIRKSSARIRGVAIADYV